MNAPLYMCVCVCLFLTSEKKPASGILVAIVLPVLALFIPWYVFCFHTPFLIYSCIPLDFIHCVVRPIIIIVVVVVVLRSTSMLPIERNPN